MNIAGACVREKEGGREKAKARREARATYFKLGKLVEEVCSAVLGSRLLLGPPQSAFKAAHTIVWVALSLDLKEQTSISLFFLPNF